jgi:lysophospholipase L1-like esterase
MTQPTTWASSDERSSSWHWLRLVADRRHGEATMDAALRRCNEAVRQVAAEQKVPLVDLERTVPKSLEYMYDDAHFTERGADRIAELLTDPVVHALSTMRVGTTLQP